MAATDTIHVERVDHIGIRVADAERAIDFYAIFGFEVIQRVEFDAVVIIRNPDDVEMNLIVNTNSTNRGRNILMDEEVKYSGFTHVALKSCATMYRGRGSLLSESHAWHCASFSPERAPVLTFVFFLASALCVFRPSAASALP